MISYTMIAKVLATFFVISTSASILFANSGKKSALSFFGRIKLLIYFSILMFAIWS